MVGNRRIHKQAPIGDLEMSRLSPAEAHDVIRRRLTRLAGRRGLKPIDTYHLARQMRTRTYAPGEILLPSGARADCLALVVRGQVAVQVGERGSTRRAIVLLPGSTFGEMMLADGRPSNATLQALTECEVRFLRRADLQALSDERRTERQVSTLWQLVRVSAVLFVVLLALVLAVSLPPGRKVLALAPMSIGQWCKDRDRDACAWQAWKTAANLAPSDPNPHLALGTLQFEQGNVAAAEQSFEVARALAPDSPEAHNNLGLIYARQGEHDRAITAFQQALELEPGIAATEHNAGRSLQAIHDYEGAVIHYQAALALGEPQVSTLLNMATAYHEMGQLEKAETATQEALRLDPDLAPAYTLLAAVALESRQPDEALPNLQRAIDLDPGYGLAYFFLGLTYKSLNQPAEAIAAFEQALVKADDEVTRVRIRRHLGELYEAEERSKTH
jgi:tetratricopeptide (TPR) repeat protein